MSVTVDVPIQVGPNSWELRWSSDLSDPQFRVYRSGKLVAQTRRTSMIFTLAEGETELIEILDDADAVAHKVNRPYMILAWDQHLSAEYYLVEEYVDGAWTEVTRIQETGELRRHSYVRSLADDTTHQLRVTVVAKSGAGTPGSLNYKLVRSPDPPHVSMSYDAGTGNVTVSAA